MEKLNDKIEALNQQLENQKASNDAILDEVMAFAKISSVILSAESADDIKVYVVPDVRYLITEDGVDAEFKADKTYKGKIFPDEQYFKFILTDSTGVDTKLIGNGTAVKILGK